MIEEIEPAKQPTESDPQASQDHGRDLTVGSIPRLLLSFSMPLLLGNMIQAGYGIVNRIWVGQYLGDSSVAAVGNAMVVIFILVAVANGLTLGSNILASQFAGGRNWDGVRRVVQNSVLLIGTLSLLLLVLGQIFAEPLLHAINAPKEAFDIALHYMRIALCSFPLIFLAILTTFLLRAVGDSVTPLIFQGVGIAIAAVLDPLLMLGWLGFPKLGLNGTAYAMLIAQSLSLIAFFLYLKRKKSIVSPDWRRLQFDLPISKLTLKIGLPAAAQQLLVSLGGMMMLRFVNEYHEAAAAGFNLASQIDMVAFFVAMSVSMAISSLVGQNIGARRYDRVKQIFWWGMALSGGCVLVISLIAVTFPHALMTMFLNAQHSPEAFRIGVSYLQIVGASYITFAVMFVCIGVVNGAGHTLVTTLITLCGLWLVRIPLAAYLSHHLHRVEGIWYALAISFTVSMTLSLVYYFSGYWKRSVIKHGALAAQTE